MIGRMYSEDHQVDSIMYAYQPFLSEKEARAIRLETEWRREMSIALDAYATESREHRRQSAIIAWLVGAFLVGFVGGLAWLVWGAL